LVGFAAKDVVADVQCEKKQKGCGSIQSIENSLQKEILSFLMTRRLRVYFLLFCLIDLKQSFLITPLK